MEMKEIGGYFELEEFAGASYYPEAISLDKGRSCLEYVIQAREISKMFIPYFLCDCIEETLLNAGIEVGYYAIDKNFHPLFNHLLSEGECLYLVNYYGQLTNEDIQAYHRKFSNILVDNTQAFFQAPVKGVDTFYTCRKFFGVPDGAYLFTDKRISVSFPRDTSHQRISHLLGRYEENASDYYANYQFNEEQLDKNSIKRMSKLTCNMLKAIPYEAISAKRKRNVEVLHQQLVGCNLLSYQSVRGAFAYPFLVDQAPEIRKALIDEKIYIPVLWPNVLEQQPKNSLDYRFANNILPLPCDQRYDEADMMRVSTVIQKFL